MLHVHKYSWQHNATCFILTTVVKIKERLLFYVVNLLMLSYWILFFWVSTVWNGSLVKTVRTACGQLRDTTNWRNFKGQCETSVIWGCDRCGIVRASLHVELTCAATALAWSGRKANLPFSSLLRTTSNGSKKRGRPFVTTWERRYPFSWDSAYALRYKAV